MFYIFSMGCSVQEIENLFSVTIELYKTCGSLGELEIVVIDVIVKKVYSKIHVLQIPFLDNIHVIKDIHKNGACTTICNDLCHKLF